MQLPNKALLFLHLEQDEFCGADKYGSWHTEFRLAMTARAAVSAKLWTPTSWGQLSPYFFSYTAQGTHDGPMANAMYRGDMEKVYNLSNGELDFRKFLVDFFHLAIMLKEHTAGLS